MDFSNHTPATNLHDATALSIAEDVGESRVSEDAGASPSSALHGQGETLRIAMALVTGATEAGADRLKKADELRARMTSMTLIKMRRTATIERSAEKRQLPIERRSICSAGGGTVAGVMRGADELRESRHCIEAGTR